MIVKLIPVLEVNYYNQILSTPKEYPYWDNVQKWDDYRTACYLLAGFTDKLVPYLPGSSFFRLTDITSKNLTKIVIDHTYDYLNGDYGRDGTCALSGGYVLNIDDIDVYFPQCCADLGDITFWRKLSDNQVVFSSGHPTPGIEIKDETISFDFSVDQFDEPFRPTPPFTNINIDKMALKVAINEVDIELQGFAERVKKINRDSQLNISQIDNLLIWDK